MTPQLQTLIKVLGYSEEQTKDFLKRQSSLNQFMSLQIIEKYKAFAQGTKLGDNMSLDALSDALIIDCHKKALELLTKEECAAVHIAQGLQVQLVLFAEMVNAVAAQQIAKDN